MRKTLESIKFLLFEPYLDEWQNNPGGVKISIAKLGVVVGTGVSGFGSISYWHDNPIIPWVWASLSLAATGVVIFFKIRHDRED